MMNESGECDFSEVRLLEDGMYLHIAKCGLSRVTTTDQQYHRACTKRCDPTYVRPVVDKTGIGYMLHGIFQIIGLGTPGCMSCNDRAKQMNDWGIEGCREHRDEIIGWLKEAAESVSLAEKAKAWLRARQFGISISITDPYGSLLDEAIRRSEAAKALGGQSLCTIDHAEKGLPKR